ncbi:MAG: riboflavin biosynthesis protein RibF [Dysgonamonadaceae bacterium]|nr:riboflavin biosynthesis protein RibF [Dysgonamonadaceae bacterium]
MEQETIATVGFFDGVHLGHRYLIRQMQDAARKANRKTAVITFPVHPRKVLQQEYQPLLLNTFEEKLNLLASAGADYCYVIDFTRAFAEMTAQEFIRQKLHGQLRVKELLVGYDHKFGKGRESGFDQYVAYGKACGMTVLRAERLPDTEHPVSSTLIRKLLSEGKMSEAAEKLSYLYSLEGTVVEGNKLGRTIGFPTANLERTDREKIVPPEGVYAVQVHLGTAPGGGKPCRGMAYIGKRPTVLPHGEKRIEVHLFDFSADLYGTRLRVEFAGFVRHDIRFNGVEDLRKQLEKDKRQVAMLPGFFAGQQ